MTEKKTEQEQEEAVVSISDDALEGDLNFMLRPMNWPSEKELEFSVASKHPLYKDFYKAPLTPTEVTTTIYMTQDKNDPLYYKEREIWNPPAELVAAEKTEPLTTTGKMYLFYGDELVFSTQAMEAAKKVGLCPYRSLFYKPRAAVSVSAPHGTFLATGEDFICFMGGLATTWYKAVTGVFQQLEPGDNRPGSERTTIGDPVFAVVFSYIGSLEDERARWNFRLATEERLAAFDKGDISL